MGWLYSFLRRRRADDSGLVLGLQPLLARNDTRVFPVGFVLLVTELVIVIEARRKKRREGWTSQ
jgi:hypothetical protein